MDAGRRPATQRERALAGEEPSEERDQPVARRQRNVTVGGVGGPRVYITSQSAKLGRGGAHERVGRTVGPVQRLRPPIHCRRPHRELAALSTAQRIALQQPRELAAFELARHRPDDLRTARPPCRHGVQPAQSGDAHDVAQSVRVVSALVERHPAEPAAPAVVRRDAERALSLDEAGQRVPVDVIDALRGRQRPHFLRRSSDCSSHLVSTVGRVTDAFSVPGLPNLCYQALESALAAVVGPLPPPQLAGDFVEERRPFSLHEKPTGIQSAACSRRTTAARDGCGSCWPELSPWSRPAPTTRSPRGSSKRRASKPCT